jgi:trans-2-enoyl-CoA reductase
MSGAFAMMTLKKKISTILTTWLALTASFFGFSLFQSPSSAKTIESRLKDVREQTGVIANDQNTGSRTPSSSQTNQNSEGERKTIAGDDWKNWANWENV